MNFTELCTRTLHWRSTLLTPVALTQLRTGVHSVSTAAGRTQGRKVRIDYSVPNSVREKVAVFRVRSGRVGRRPFIRHSRLRAGRIVAPVRYLRFGWHALRRRAQYRASALRGLQRPSLPSQARVGW